MNFEIHRRVMLQVQPDSDALPKTIADAAETREFRILVPRQQRQLC